MPATPAGAVPVAVVGVVSEAQGMRRDTRPDSEVFESVDGATEAAAIGVPVGNVQMTRNLGADGRPLPEGVCARECTNGKIKGPKISRESACSVSWRGVK